VIAGPRPPPTEEELHDASKALFISHCDKLSVEQREVIQWAIGFARGRLDLPADEHDARNTMRLRVLLGTLLQEIPAPKLGRMVEIIATMRGDQALAALQVATWHHEGMAAFVAELADRLQPKREA
jgi:hypothetical protein